MLVNVRDNKLATNRTKTRMRQHGPIFFLKDRSNGVFGFQGIDCVHLVSEKDGWFGWIPENEVVIESC